MQAFRSSRRAASTTQRAAVELPIIYSKMVDTADGPREVEETEVFLLHGQVSTLTLSDAALMSDVGIETLEGAAMLAKIFAEAFADQVEFKRFKQFAGKYLDNDDLAELMGQVVEETTGTPTQQSSPSSSSSPPTTTGEPSRGTSLPQGPLISAIPEGSSHSEPAPS